MSFKQSLKKYLIGAIVGGLMAFPAGVNIGKGQPLLSNPFTERSLTAEVRGKAKSVISDTKEALREKLRD